MFESICCTTASDNIVGSVDYKWDRQTGKKKKKTALIVLHWLHDGHTFEINKVVKGACYREPIHCGSPKT